MQFARGRNHSDVKVSNQSSILQMIYHCGPIKRTEIAEQLDLTLPTITTNVNRMIEAGVVREVDETGKNTGNLGRKARLVEIVPGSRYFLGIEVQCHQRAVCVVDFRGEILRSRRDNDLCTDYEKDIRQCGEMASDVLAQCGLSLDQLSGVGLCSPGLVDARSGVLDAWPAYDWRGKHLRDDITAVLGYDGPVSVENNACARAYGARLSRRELLNDAHNFAYMLVSRGIACPFFINTATTFGSVVGTGEVGHTILQPDGLPCVCGNHGCLEAYSSDRAVIAACRELLEKGGAPVLRDICSGGEPDMAQIVEAQRAGDKDVESVAERAIKYIGLSTANVTNFTRPGIMFVEGYLFQVERNRDRLLDQVRSIQLSTFQCETEFIFVEPDLLGGARGAGALAICKYLVAGRADAL